MMIPIWSPKPREIIRGVILSTRYTGVWTHFIDGRTQPHLNDDKLCPGCLLGRSKRWKAYIAVWSERFSRVGLFELTTEAVRTCPAFLNEQNNLRGWKIALERKGIQPNSPVHADLTRMDPSPKLRPDIDVLAALTKIWNSPARATHRQARAGEGLEPYFDKGGVK